MAQHNFELIIWVSDQACRGQLFCLFPISFAKSIIVHPISIKGGKGAKSIDLSYKVQTKMLFVLQHKTPPPQQIPFSRDRC